MNRKIRHTRTMILLAALMLAAALPACTDKPSPTFSSLPATRPPDTSLTDGKRLSDGASKLIDAMKKPTGSFHFSFKGQENITSGWEQCPACSSRDHAGGYFPGGDRA